ncbi:MAG: hypothetical protein ABFD50_22450 [Smithella sp.]
MLSNIKNLNDLKSNISDFENFCKFIKENKFMISTGKLSEYYCHLLFNIKIKKKSNALYDGEDSESKKVEIKQRRSVSKSPSGMKIDLKRIDYVLYVFLDEEDLLPDEIIKIEKECITETSNGRVSFNDAFNNKKFTIKYKR